MSVWSLKRLHIIYLVIFSMASSSLLSLSLPKPSIIRATAITTPTSTTITTPASAESLEQKFGRKGIKFSDLGDVELTVRNGSSLKLQIPNAHVTSYKPKVYWKDDGFEEILYTLPLKPNSSSGSAKGGIGLVLNNVSAAAEPKSRVSGSVSPVDTSQWIVKDVDSDSIDAVQVMSNFLVLFLLNLT